MKRAGKENEIHREDFEKKLKFKISPENLELVMFAYYLAARCHRGQQRESGEPYFEHPKRVALILIDELQIYDHEMIIAELLHDVKEDEDALIIKWGQIKQFFGDRVFSIIKALTKRTELDKRVRERIYKTGLRKSDPHTQISKLADRLDNLRYLESLSRDRQRKIIAETKRYYLPLALKSENKHLAYLYEEIANICFPGGRPKPKAKTKDKIKAKTETRPKVKIGGKAKTGPKAKTRSGAKTEIKTQARTKKKTRTKNK